MCPADRINFSVAPRCLVQCAICQKLDPKLHMPAAVCKGLRQTMSGTMDLAVPLAERLSCQLHKKPHARREQKVWPRGEFMLSESFAWRPFTSPHFLLHHYSRKKKKSVLFRRLQSRATDRRGGSYQCVQAGETALQRLGFKFCLCFWLGLLAPQETHYCTSKQTAPLCWGVWRPLEPWNKPAGPSLRLAWNQKQYVEHGKHFRKRESHQNKG